MYTGKGRVDLSRKEEVDLLRRPLPLGLILYYLFSLKEHTNIPIISTLTMYTPIQYTNIFSDFLLEVEIKVDIKRIIEQTYTLKTKTESKSNIGGYHSKIYSNNTVDGQYGLLNTAFESCVNEWLEKGEYRSNFRIKSYDWWFNINNYRDYNNIHMHSGSDLIAIYYIQVPEDSGQLRMVRNDGAVYSKLGSMRSVYQCSCIPEHLYVFPGHLWHHVTANNSHIDRISVAYNIFLQ